MNRSPPNLPQQVTSLT